MARLRVLCWIWAILFASISIQRGNGSDGDWKQAALAMESKCGPACLYVLLTALQLDLPDFDGFARGFRNHGNNISLYDLERKCQEYSVEAKCLAVSVPEINSWQTCLFIAHLKEGHFVLMARNHGNKFLLVDPPNQRIVDISEVQESLSGNVLLVGSLARSSRGIVFFLGWSAIFFMLIGVAYVLFFQRRLFVWRRRRGISSGFTIVELLVVLAILTLFIGLSASALHAARESARRLACSNNLRQIAMAMQNYTSGFRQFPAGAGSPKQESPYYAIQVYMEKNEIDLGRFYFGTKQINSLFVYSPNVVSCPSDPIEKWGSYRFCTGDSAYADRRYPLRLQPGRGVFLFPGSVRLAEVTDGLSYTAIVSERKKSDLHSPRQLGIVYANLTSGLHSQLPLTGEIDSRCDSSGSLPYYMFSGRDWLCSGLLGSWYNHVRGPNAIHDCTVENSATSTVTIGGIVSASSYHNGCNVAFADGSVRIYSSTVDTIVWRSFGSKSGGEATVEVE
ncbi:DUF1559 domain-containing protein [Pirellulaceae bacterium SH449]